MAIWTERAPVGINLSWWCFKPFPNQSKQIEAVLGSGGPRVPLILLVLPPRPTTVYDKSVTYNHLVQTALNPNCTLPIHMGFFCFHFLDRGVEKTGFHIYGENTKCILSSCFKSRGPDTTSNTPSFLLLPSSRQMRLSNSMREGTQVQVQIILLWNSSNLLNVLKITSKKTTTLSHHCHLDCGLLSLPAFFHHSIFPYFLWHNAKRSFLYLKDSQDYKEF